MRKCKADRRNGEQGACLRNFIEITEGDPVDAAEDQRQNVSGQQPEQNRDLAPGTLQVDGEQDGRKQGHNADSP